MTQRERLAAAVQTLGPVTFTHAEESDCPHRYCEEAPCPGNADDGCDFLGKEPPCDPKVCGSAAWRRLLDAAKAVLETPDKIAELRASATGWEKEATNESALSIVEDELDKSREHWARGDTLGKCAAAIFAIVGRE